MPVEPKALEGGVATKDGPMVANAGLVTEMEVRRESISLGLKAYEA